MYNVSRGPSRIINRTRRDINQKLENFDQIRELTRKNNSDSDEGDHHHHNHHNQTPENNNHNCHQQEPTMTSPRPVFQNVLNNKGCRSTNGKGPSHEVITPQHEELIRFFTESWGRVMKEVEMNRQSGHDSRAGGIAYYQDKHVHPALKDFKAFDLESWWGKRIYQNLTQSS